MMRTIRISTLTYVRLVVSISGETKLPVDIEGRL